MLVNREVDGAPADSCVTDNRCGATLVANLLAESGHRAIGAVFGPSETSTGRDREAGLSAGLGDHGIDLRPGLVRRGPFSYQPDYAATLELIDLPDRPTAIFCGNDVIALEPVMQR